MKNTQQKLEYVNKFYIEENYPFDLTDELEELYFKEFYRCKEDLKKQDYTDTIHIFRSNIKGYIMRHYQFNSDSEYAISNNLAELKKEARRILKDKYLVNR